MLSTVPVRQTILLELAPWPSKNNSGSLGVSLGCARVGGCPVDVVWEDEGVGEERRKTGDEGDCSGRFLWEDEEGERDDFFEWAGAGAEEGARVGVVEQPKIPSNELRQR